MTDLALIFDASEGGTLSFDLGVSAGGLTLDEGLATAVFISLFTDRRARADDDLPGLDSDRGGWWADAIPEVEGDLIGSRLWLLRRSKATPETLRRAREMAEEALAWMIEDGVAASIAIEVETIGAPPAALALAIGVTITRPDGSRHRFDHVWEAL